MTDFFEKHGELIHWILAGVQVTLSQVALWSFIPAKAALIMGGVAGLCSAWVLLIDKFRQRREAKIEAQGESQ